MGLRTRIKERLGGLLGNEPAAPPPAPLRPVARSSAPETGQAPTAARPATPAAPQKALSPEEQAKQDKIAAHFEKARRGVLRNLAERGGAADMADMHDYSEKKFFVAHQGFSRMMEGFVAEGLVDYDARTGATTLTERGRTYIETPPG